MGTVWRTWGWVGGLGQRVPMPSPALKLKTLWIFSASFALNFQSNAMDSCHIPGNARWFLFMSCCSRPPGNKVSLVPFYKRGVQPLVPRPCSLPLLCPVPVKGLWWLGGFLSGFPCITLHLLSVHPRPSFLQVGASRFLSDSVPLYYLWPECATKSQHRWYQFPTLESVYYYLKQVQTYQERQAIKIINNMLYRIK